MGLSIGILTSVIGFDITMGMREVYYDYFRDYCYDHNGFVFSNNSLYKYGCVSYNGSIIEVPVGESINCDEYPVICESWRAEE